MVVGLLRVNVVNKCVEHHRPVADFLIPVYHPVDLQIEGYQQVLKSQIVGHLILNELSVC